MTSAGEGDRRGKGRCSRWSAELGGETEVLDLVGWEERVEICS